MSMFYELMMRKKEEIMYATIKGSPTQSPYGVFSGFSSSNYLQLQNDIDTSKDWEFVVKFDNTTSKYHSVILGSNSTANSIKIEISYGTRFFIFLSSNGTSWNIADGVYGETNAMSLGNTYYMKLTYSSVSGYKLFLSTDKVNWTLQWSNGTTNALYMTNAKFVLGASLFDSNSLGGGIDLNRSYVKSQSTKYRLQAVVGYTVVGSPTIVDGVVSGFSSANYIYVPNFDIGDDFEFVTKFKITETNNNNYLLRLPKGNVNINMSLYLNNTNKISLALHYNNKPNTVTAGATIFSLNTETYIKIIQKGNFTKLFSSLDNSNWIEEMSIQTDKDIRGSGTGYDMSFGIASVSSGYYFHGDIYIKDTYIKINNKLWFKGQQA